MRAEGVRGQQPSGMPVKVHSQEWLIVEGVRDAMAMFIASLRRSEEHRDMVKALSAPSAASPAQWCLFGTTRMWMSRS